MSNAMRISLSDLRQFRARGTPFAMLTAYDFPTAAAAQAAGIPVLLIGDSMGTVLLGQNSTRLVPLALMLILGEAVRRGAPHVYLVGDLPFEAISGGEAAILRAATRFRDEAGCDAVKIEADVTHAAVVERLAAAGFEVIVHLGLRPQAVLTADGYRAQAREAGAIAALVAESRVLVQAGAALVLLEAVPNEAAAAVVAAVDVPVIGCGAGPACHGHVVVTQDLLGWGATRPPRFVPVLAQVGRNVDEALRRYAAAIADRTYPGPEHVYPMRRAAADPSRPES